MVYAEEEIEEQKDDIWIEVLNKIKDKSINHNIFRIQDNISFMCEFYCIAFVEKLY